MVSRGFEVKPLFLKPALTIYDWASGKPWEVVVNDSELVEGDLARLILRTTDNLRHVSHLAEIFPKEAAASIKSIQLIKREPVVSYYEA